jgi:hypothetical protein
MLCQAAAVLIPFSTLFALEFTTARSFVHLGKMCSLTRPTGSSLCNAAAMFLHRLFIHYCAFSSCGLPWTGFDPLCDIGVYGL